jgi:hypothetical protein
VVQSTHMPRIFSIYRDGVLRFISSIRAKNSRARGLPKSTPAGKAVSITCAETVFSQNFAETFCPQMEPVWLTTEPRDMQAGILKMRA